MEARACVLISHEGHEDHEGTRSFFESDDLSTKEDRGYNLCYYVFFVPNVKFSIFSKSKNLIERGDGKRMGFFFGRREVHINSFFYHSCNFQGFLAYKR